MTRAEYTKKFCAKCVMALCGGLAGDPNAQILIDDYCPFVKDQVCDECGLVIKNEVYNGGDFLSYCPHCGAEL